MSNFIDKNGKLFGKISIIDLLIFGMVVLVFFGIMMRQARTQQDVQVVQDTQINYTIEIANVRYWARYNIRPGDSVFSSNTQVGTVVAVTYEPYTTTVATAQGVFQAEVPNRYTTRIHVEARAMIDGGRVLVSHSIPMGSGNANMQFTTRYANFTGRISELNYEH